MTEANIQEGLREVRTALLEADVNFNVVQDFMKRVNDKAVGAQLIKSVRPEQQIVKIVHDEMIELIGRPTRRSGSKRRADHPDALRPARLGQNDHLRKTRPLAGQSQGRKPLLVAADLQRPAAVDQLKVIGQQFSFPVYSQSGSNARSKSAKTPCSRPIARVATPSCSTPPAACISTTT